MRVRCLFQVEAFDCYQDQLEITLCSRDDERHQCRLSDLPVVLVRDIRRGDYLIATMILNDEDGRLMGLDDWEKAPDPVVEGDL